MGVALFLAINSNNPINPSNMKIKKVVCAPGKTGFFFDDQKAIKKGAKNDGAFYSGDPVTPGFTLSLIHISGRSAGSMRILRIVLGT